MKVIFAWVTKIIDFKSRMEYYSYLSKLDGERVSYMVVSEYNNKDIEGNDIFTAEIKFKYKDYNNGGF